MTALVGPASDERDVGRVQTAPAALRPFNAAGVLGPADVHVAVTLARLLDVTDPQVLLAVALAVRAPRFGHVCADLASVRATVTADEDVAVDLATLPWPDVDEWVEELRESPLLAVGEDEADDRPLRLVGCRLYLDRYWRHERRVVADLRARAAGMAGGLNVAALRAGLDRLFPRSGQAGDVPEPLAGPDRQRLAAAVAVLRRFAVIAGGPGTGKTTTVARVLALLEEQSAAGGRAPLRIGLAAPTGKAADRLEQAIHDAASELDTTPAVRERLLGYGAFTVHRLLGTLPGSRTRFRHDSTNPLPHDVVVVDETSMVSLTLMARLLEAVRPTTRLLLVGDPEQLASVEAGAVLGDIVGPVRTELQMTAGMRARLSAATGEALLGGVPLAGAPLAGATPSAAAGQPVPRGGPPPAEATLPTAIGEPAPGGEPSAEATPSAAIGEPAPEGEPSAEATPSAATGEALPGGGPLAGATLADSIVVLTRVHRFRARSGIADLAAAIQRGNADGALEVLGSGREDIRWIAAEASDPATLGAALDPVRSAVAAKGARVVAAARSGDGPAALAALGELRVLCAHRRGPSGVATWGPAVERWLVTDLDGFEVAEPWYPGRPVLVTRNDYQVGVYNGDVGVVVTRPDGAVTVAFEHGEVAPSRLEAIETLHAMTVHKAQGSQFRAVVVVLPDPASPLLSRELLYTAVTRAREAVTVVGPAAAVRTATERRIQRASGLREALWGTA
ncbi:MAG TPA: AAA family ATPase [Nitriliruptorales bacterium]|nr:AAA family ATPase [Nitriliruptorales bacterium]